MDFVFTIIPTGQIGLPQWFFTLCWIHCHQPNCFPPFPFTSINPFYICFEVCGPCITDMVKCTQFQSLFIFIVLATHKTISSVIQDPLPSIDRGITWFKACTNWLFFQTILKCVLIWLFYRLQSAMSIPDFKLKCLTFILSIQSWAAYDEQSARARLCHSSDVAAYKQQ